LLPLDVICGIDVREKGGNAGSFVLYVATGKQFEFYTTKIASQRVSELCSQSFSEFLANQSEDNSVYMSFQSALFHIEARKGSFGSSSQALRA